MKLLALIKKEFHRFFHDPRLLVTMLLPGLLIFVLYSILGAAINGGEGEEQNFKVYLSGESQAAAFIQAAVEGSGNTVEWLPLEDGEEAREAVKKGDAAAILSFSDGFDGAERGQVRIVYNAADDAGSLFCSLASAALQTYGMRFDVLPENLATESDVGMKVMQSVLPFIIVCFIFSACMSVTLESVAGEKERGTLATILVTSVSRTHIALGKVVPLGCISMLGALSSFLGVALSMPKLMGVDLGFLGGYSFGSYALLFLLILSVVPLIVSLISAISTCSRSVKEASAYTSILMVLVMVVSLVTAFMPTLGDWSVAIPVLNAVLCMQAVLGGAVPVWQTFVSVGANLLYTALLVAVISWMLSNEKIMFGK